MQQILAIVKMRFLGKNINHFKILSTLHMKQKINLSIKLNSTGIFFSMYQKYFVPKAWFLF
jgi:hypothetical protein